MWDLQDPEWIDINEVSRRVSLPAGTIYALARQGAFPKQTRMHPCVARWRATEVELWLKENPPERRGAKQSPRRRTIEHTRQDSGSTKPTTFEEHLSDSIAPHALRFLRLPEVLQRIGLCKAEVYNRIKRGEFPSPVRISKTRVAWVESGIVEWQQKIILDSRLQSEFVVPIFRTPRMEIVPPTGKRESTMKTSTNNRTSKNVASIAWSDDYAEQNADGRERAKTVLRDMVKSKFPDALHHRRQGIVDSGAPAGVLIGFDHFIAAVAICGSAAVL